MTFMHEDESKQATPPDYAAGNFLLLAWQFCDFCRLVGVDSPAFLAISELVHDCYRGVGIRGARMGALVDAVRALRPTGPRRIGEEIDPTDFKVASMALWVSERGEDARRLGLHYEVFERLRLLAKAIDEAISERGATVADLIAALRAVRPHGSILEDLPVIQAKLRERNE